MRGIVLVAYFIMWKADIQAKIMNRHLKRTIHVSFIIACVVAAISVLRFIQMVSLTKVKPESRPQVLVEATEKSNRLSKSSSSGEKQIIANSTTSFSSSDGVSKSPATLQIRKLKVYKDTKKLESIRFLGDLKEPVDGKALDQRRVVFNGLKNLSDAKMNVGYYVANFSKVEEMVNRKEPEDQILKALDTVRESYSDNILSTNHLKDQLYADGPMSSMCRSIEKQLREHWVQDDGFKNDVWLFCRVNPDGTIGSIVTDDPVKYGEKTCSKVQKLLQAVSVSSTSDFSIPLVVTLNNSSEKTQVYVRHLNLGPFYSVLSQTIRHYWDDANLGRGKRVRVKFKIWRDGTISESSVLRSSGDILFDMKALQVLQQASKFSHFPDGGHEFSECEHTLGYVRDYDED